MNFDILDTDQNLIQLRCNNIIFMGNIAGNNRSWYKLTGNVTQNDQAVVRAIYQPASWRAGTHPFNPVISVDVNPLANGDVDVYID